MPQLSLRRFGLLVTIVLGVFFAQLGGARLWDRDEPRNARASHEMLVQGDWIVPTFNGQLRDHKPVLLYWGQMAAYLAVGESTWSARLPSALAAALCVAAIAWLASRLSGCPRGINNDGFWAAAALATSLLFVMAGRAATPDALLIAFSTLGIALLASSCLRPAHPYSSGYVGPARWLAAMAGYLALGLAALAKGPVGIILPLAVVGSWWLVCKQHEARDRSSSQAVPNRSKLSWWLSEAWQTVHPWRFLQAIWHLRIIPGVALALLAAAPWYVAVGLETDGAFLRGFFIDHNVGRAMQSMEGHSGGWWFYPLAFVIGIFPWSLWLIPLGLWGKQAAGQGAVQRQMLSLALLWIAVYVVAFSFARTKLPSYITPCYAGAALWIGGYLRQFESTWSMPSVAWRRIAYGVTAVCGCVITGAIVWVSQREQMPALLVISTAGMVVALTAVIAWTVDHTGRTNWVPATWLAGAVCFQCILFAGGSTVVDGYRSDLNMLKQVAAEENAVSPLRLAPRRWLAIGGMEPSWVYYLNTQIVEVGGTEPADWLKVQSFWREHPDGNVVAVGEAAQQLEKAVYPLSVQRLAQAKRFLRAGDVVVFRLPADDRPGSPAMTAEQRAGDTIQR